MGIRQARDIGRAKTAFQLLMAAAVANLTYLAASSSHASDATSGPFGLLVVLFGLLVLLVCCVRRPIWPAEAPDALRLAPFASRGRPLTSLPTALIMPGCRPGF